MDQILTISALITLFMILFIVLSAFLDGRLFVLQRTAKAIILLICFAAILSKTIFFRAPGRNYRYALTLFWSYKQAIAGNLGLAKEIILNILLYMPFGFTLPAVFQTAKLWQMILLLVLLSGTIELIQLVAKIGLFEFDDIFDNTLGGMIGIFCCRVMSGRKRSKH